MSNDWQVLSVRQGRREPGGPYERMPTHLRYTVGEWLRARFGRFRAGGMDEALMDAVASALRIPVQRTYKTGGVSDQIFAAIERGDDLYLNCVDVTLHLSRGASAASLAEALAVGGSVWTVSAGQYGLDRVSVATSNAFAHAVAASDSVVDESRCAWAAVFGRYPDPSDGWDHAIWPNWAVLVLSRPA